MDLIDRTQLMTYIRSNKINIGKLSHDIIMEQPSIETIKTEESEESGIKYFNINVSRGEVERKPDIVRICSDAGILEYVIKEKKNEY